MTSQHDERLIAPRTITTTHPTMTSDYNFSGRDRSRRRSTGSTTDFNENSVPEAMDSSYKGSSDGYAADHSAHPSLPSIIDGVKSMKRSNETALSSFEPAFKLLRTRYNKAELNHLAKNAKSQIEQSGLMYPKLQSNLPRRFPPKSGVDMSSVTHVFSSDYKSPFLAESTGKKAKSNYMGCPNEISSLLKSTSSFYSVHENETLPSSFVKVIQMIEQNRSENTPLNNNYERESCSDSESSTSSVTVSESDGYYRSSDGDQSNSQGKPLTTSNSNNNSLIDTSIITIGEALDISRRPRIITLAQAPHTIVQVNAAFLRLTQSKSTSDFMGKPLADVMEMMSGDSSGSSFVSGLNSSYTTMQKVSLVGYPNLLRPRKSATCTSGTEKNHKIRRISIIPVGVPPKKDATDGKVTHFAIKFSVQQEPRPISTLSTTSVSSSNFSTSSGSVRPSSYIANRSINVMG